MVWYDVVWFGVLLCDLLQYGVVRYCVMTTTCCSVDVKYYNMLQCGVARLQHDAVWFSELLCGVLQHEVLGTHSVMDSDYLFKGKSCH